VAQLVDALRYKPAGRGTDSRWGLLGFFIDLISSGRTMALGSTQPLTGISTRGISFPDYLEILGASTFWGPKGLSKP
jgi:hypothetical protein